MRLLIISVVVAFGCDVERQEHGAISRDSAGIEIREIQALAAERPINVGGEPVVAIGAIDAGPDYQFVDVAGALLLSDGRIVVADRGANYVRYFDAEGQILVSVGGAGEGPGEFRALQAIGRFSGDSIYALDRRLQRITVLDESGRVASTIQLPVYVVGTYPLDDRRWVAATAEGYFGGTLDEHAQPGLKRSPAPILILSADGAIADTLASPPGQEMAYIRTGERIGTVPAAFGRILSLAVRGTHVYVTTGDIHGYDMYHPDRGLVQSTRLTGGGDREVRPTDVAAFQGAILAEIADTAARANYAALLDAAEVPSTKAPVSRIVIDHVGGVWLSEYENPYFSSGVWHVVDAEGLYRGRVQTPPSFRVTDVRGSRVVGVWRDVFGIQSVRVYEIAVH